jgi:hypothetical protein
LAQPHTVNARTITVDKNAAYPKATTAMKKDGKLWRRSLFCNEITSIGGVSRLSVTNDWSDEV